MTTLSFLSALDQLPELRPFPASASQVVSACNDPDLGSTTLSGIIKKDPGLSLKLLRTANSSMYGYSGRVTTVDQAVVILGMKAVRNLSIAAAATMVFSQGATAATQRQTLWAHSLGCATVAQHLAKRTQAAKPDEAFVGGLLHDVGKLIFYDLVPDEYLCISANATSSTILERETTTFGATHQEVGLICAEQWGLPDEISQTIGSHHATDATDDRPELVRIVSFANSLCTQWGYGRNPSCDESALSLIAAGFDLQQHDLDEIQTLVAEEYSVFKASLEA